jgi:hypothetical protein
MTDPSRDPHGPERLPDEQPVPTPTNVTDQPALRYGAASRWLVPAGVLAAVTTVLYCFAFQIQVILPIIGIVYVVTMWVVMLVSSRRATDRVANNRRLAWLMGAMAVGALLVAIAIYIVESTRLPWT